MVHEILGAVLTLAASVVGALLAVRHHRRRLADQPGSGDPHTRQLAAALLFFPLCLAGGVAGIHVGQPTLAVFGLLGAVIWDSAIGWLLSGRVL